MVWKDIISLLNISYVISADGHCSLDLYVTNGVHQSVITPKSNPALKNCPVINIPYPKQLLHAAN